MMEWDNKQQPSNQNTVNGGGGGGGMYAKVMTDEQLETLRKQIAMYAAICEQLIQMHKTLTSQHDLAGGRLGGLYSEVLMSSAGHKVTARQRWTPTPVQLQILERLFDQGHGTPGKQKIKEITAELSQHGQISETNVYNWFQNRRARSKRKQQVGTSSNNNDNNNNGGSNGESEVETEVESPNEKRTKPEESLVQPQSNSNNGAITGPRPEDLCFQSYEMTSELHFLGVLSNPREHEHLGGQMESPDSYINLYNRVGDYH